MTWASYGEPMAIPPQFEKQVAKKKAKAKGKKKVKGKAEAKGNPFADKAKGY